jgi:hypothetical protein
VEKGSNEKPPKKKSLVPAIAIDNSKNQFEIPRSNTNFNSEVNSGQNTSR